MLFANISLLTDDSVYFAGDDMNLDLFQKLAIGAGAKKKKNKTVGLSATA